MKKKVFCGNVPIGGGSPVTVQSMTNTRTTDIEGTVSQIISLEEVGCDLVRCAVPDIESARAIREIKKKIHIPIIADIHFDYRLALESILMGADGIRLNPGNIGTSLNVKEVVTACKDSGIKIRVGVNSGSLKQDFLDQYGGVNKHSMVESALQQVSIIEKCGYDNIVISLKSSDVRLTYDSYKLMNEKNDYPLHLGVTEAGTFINGTIKSSVGIGSLLLEGIGDTIRISLTDDPKNEVLVGRKMLQFLKLRPYGPNIISCPTCGRTKINLEKIANEVEDRLKGSKKDISVAIMGCIVNGPGEAKEAEIGIAGGNGYAMLFKKGKIIRRIKEDEIVETLIEEIQKL
ncbi:MAG: flavodoxin-dependent (E)-4-hydroxy-3-methylbut-2-enyl-diphosphate synthase [Tissierellales bacterium]|nr:flavodoxin-dependent (E)-4-hydroxy-3-methylbut-2-enyl-diphosphate synthase [Tissierellales bacterium]MBN2827960.1 flavodoxin-dependent (E)-4-hydroxy-3-methylbut-2-enyl-diphosphate synthase [Tissierellales bacterium]